MLIAVALQTSVTCTARLLFLIALLIRMPLGGVGFGCSGFGLEIGGRGASDEVA